MMWLIGCKGMLGTEIALALERHRLPFVGTDKEIDISDRGALSGFAAAQKTPFTWIINCAAYTAVDKAEDDAENCRLLNTTGAANIAAATKSIGARLIHFSPDYVFDGKGITGPDGRKRPYREDDPTNPTGVYGLTKRDGENAVLENNPRSYIIRTAWLYGQYGKNFVTTMLNLMKERDTVTVVDDQRGSPTWARDLAETTIEIVTAKQVNKAIPYGIYHYTNEGNITWYDFAREIHDVTLQYGLLPKACTTKPCTSAEYPTRAKRPEFSVLDKTKIKLALGLRIPTWDLSLIRYLQPSYIEKSIPITTDIRWKQRYENYNNALARLTEVIQRYSNIEFDVIGVAACIKYFEMTFELAWKVMKDFLKEKGITEIIGSKDSIRHAVNNGILDAEETWMKMVESRNKIVHTYDEGFASELVTTIKDSYHNLFLVFSAQLEKYL
jgi:dTDP-4-dehydrorhamnose reductase